MKSVSSQQLLLRGHQLLCGKWHVHGLCVCAHPASGNVKALLMKSVIHGTKTAICFSVSVTLLLLPLLLWKDSRFLFFIHRCWMCCLLTSCVVSQLINI